MSDRRDALKIIGAIGSTCAFPFASDELYGQHQHPAPGQGLPMGPPKFFTPEELKVLNRLTDLIIPATKTPGAVAAGVPLYIDQVVSTNAQHQDLYRSGIAWMNQQKFLSLTEKQQVALLTPLCEAADSGQINSLPQAFFRAVKSMTADGYYTSRIGLVDELSYRGNTVLAEFPSCEEH